LRKSKKTDVFGLPAFRGAAMAASKFKLPLRKTPAGVYKATIRIENRRSQLHPFLLIFYPEKIIKIICK
jgi:hypothetical protein